MKNTFKYFAAALTVIAAVSCAKQELAPEEGKTPDSVGTYQYILNVTQEDTKVSMDGLSVLWEKDDQIGILGQAKTKEGIDEETGETIYTNEYRDVEECGGAQSILDSENYTPSTSATFNLQLTEGHTPLAASYPYYSGLYYTQSSKEPVNGGHLCCGYTPAEQTARKDNIPAGAMTMVGRVYSTDNTCQLMNVCAVIKFEIKNEDITSLRFEGNNSEIISGMRLYFVREGKNSPDVLGTAARDAASATSYVNLVPEGDVFEPGVYYFTVSPNNLTEGFTMTLTNSNGVQAIRRTDVPFNIERNTKYTNFGSDSGWFKDVFTVNASDLGTADGTTATLIGVVASAIAEGDEYGFETSTDGTTWTKFEGALTERFSSLSDSKIQNIFTATQTGLTPGATTYYRAYYKRASTGAITYGKSKSFETYANAKSVKMDLLNGWNDTNWPFTNLIYGTDLKSGTSSVATNKSNELTLTTSSGSFIARASSGFWLNTSNGALTFKPNVGEYIKLPVEGGKRPVCVIMTFGNSNGQPQGKPAIYMGNEESSAQVAGGAPFDGSKTIKYDSHTWNLSNTNDSQHMIYFGSKSNCYLSYLEVVYEEVSTDDSTINQNLIFCDGTGDHNDGATVIKTWPFTGSHTALPTWSNQAGPFWTTTYPDLKYSFHVEVESGDFWGHTRAGFFFGGTIGDYMSFLPVENYKITYIKIRSGSAATKYSVQDTSGSIVNGGDEVKISSTYDSIVEFELTGTSPNTEYRLVLGSEAKAGRAAIREMWITYERVD